MRRILLLAPVAGAAALAAGFFLLRPSSLPADAAQAEAPRTNPIALPVTQVVLFSSGVGYFQREGHIEGTSRIDLTFPVQDINDLLRSMVLQDLGGGHVSAVSYDSHDPIDRTLKSFAVNLTGNPSQAQLLNQARGEKVEVVLQQSAPTQPGTMTGTIIGVEKQRQPVGKDAAVEVELMNLWCAEGLRSVKLADVQRVRFLNPTMDSEMKRALEVLALSHDTQKKAVSLNFAGVGKRPVKVGYVVENPIWKTSYRLVLDKKGKPFLQGWAVVENPTDEDWKDVRMALISGRPISFQMDLYQPLYVPRPMVEPELFSSLRPVAYSTDMSLNVDSRRVQDRLKDLQGEAPAKKAESKAREASLLDQKAQLMDRYQRMLQLSRAGAVGKAELEELRAQLVELEKREDPRQPQGGGLLQTFGRPAREADDEIDLRRGGMTATSAASLGDYFQYAIDHPVNLPRQKSAMLPIVNKEVEGSRISIYNEQTLAKHPLLGLKFKNTSGLHLMQGPITVFDNNNYAGDARVLDLQPNEERLISYAIDLGTEALAEPEEGSGKVTAVKIQKGVIHTTTRVRQGRSYSFKNRSEQDRTVILEHPFRPEFKLTSADKPVETARDVYRFEVKVPAGKTVKQTVSEERDVSSEVTFTNSDDESIRILLKELATSPAVKTALTRATELRMKLAQTQQEVANVKRELEQVKQDQPRLRQNLEKIPGTEPLAKRILEKLNQQETDIEKYETQLKKLNTQADQQRKEYEGYLAGLTVE